MNFVTKLAAAAVIAGSAVFASGAQAGPGDRVFSNGGLVTATFIGSSAADVDILKLTANGNEIFRNSTTSPGASFQFGPIAAGTEIVFFLQDLTTPNQFNTGTIQARVEDTFNTTLFPNLAQANANSTGFSLIAPGTVFVGFEDRTITSSDQDYNDLVFAVRSGGSPVTVPEPATMALLGAGLIGLGATRRRKTA